MELELARSQMSCYEPILDTTVFREETMEMIVPDACPDILHLVDTCATVCLKSKLIQDGRLEVTGTACCQVLYQPDGDSGTRHIEVEIPFTCTLERQELRGECAANVRVWARGAETRVLNPRKVLVKVDLAVEAQGFSRCEQQLCSSCGDSGEAEIQQLVETHETYVVACVQEKPFQFSDELAIPSARPEAEELLKSRVRLACNESKIIGSKLIFKGEALLQLLYRAVSGEVCGVEFPLPFSQIMEVSDAGEESSCTVDVALTQLVCALSGEGRSVSVSMELLAQATVREVRSVELLADIYSIKGQLEPGFETYRFDRLLEQGSKRQSVREIIETPLSARSVVDAYMTAGAVEQSREGTRLTVSSAVTVTVLYETEEGELCPVSRTLSVPCVLELPEECVCTCRCVSPEAVFAAAAAGGVEIRMDLDFAYLAMASMRAVGVSAATLEESGPDLAEHPSIVLRRVGSERLWDIAKSYRTTRQDILQANALTEGDSLCGKLLLIPERR